MSQLHALIISIFIESLVIGLLVLVFSRSFSRLTPLCMLAIAGATMLTHPCAWRLNRMLMSDFSFPIRAALIEALVIFAEAGLLCVMVSLSKRHALVLAIAANTMSFLFGLLR
jgi:hypothetical protein